MKLTINKIDFTIEPVPDALRAAVLADPVMQQGVTRRVWEWDRTAGKGKALISMAENGAIPLGNALAFFVPKGTGPIQNNEKLARRMSQRFLETVGAKDVMGVLRSLVRVLPLPRVGVPHDPFRPFDKLASYRLRMETEFSVVRLHEPSRNLAAFLCVPTVVAFVPEIIEISDQEAWESLLKEKPALANARPSVVLPEGGRANGDLRRLAAGQRIREMRPQIEAAQASGAQPDPVVARAFARLVQEWRVLVPQTAKPAPAVH